MSEPRAAAQTLQAKMARVIQRMEVTITEIEEFQTKEDLLIYLKTSNDSLNTKSQKKAQWNKTHPQNPVTRTEWDFNEEKKKQRETNTNAPSSGIKIETKPKDTGSKPFDFDANPSKPKTVQIITPTQKAKKKKSTLEEKYPPNSIYNGPLAGIGLDHYPLNHSKRVKRESKPHHGRRAKTTTIFTDAGFTVANDIIERRSRLRVLKVTPGGDVIVADQSSGLFLGIHTNGIVYPTTKNGPKFIETDKG